MTLSEDFCTQRANAAAIAAAATSLDNIRDQQLAAEATWRKMAAQAARLTNERAERESQRQVQAEEAETAAKLAADRAALETPSAFDMVMLAR